MAQRRPEMFEKHNADVSEKIRLVFLGIAMSEDLSKISDVTV